MRKISFSVNVQARAEVIWQIMLDRIEHPPASALRQVRIVERGDHFLIREVRARWQLAVERVTIDEGRREIRFAVVEHPQFHGSATMRAVPLSRQSPVSPVQLIMTLEWFAKSDEAERAVLKTMPEEIRQEVLSVKEEAEARDLG